MLKFLYRWLFIFVSFMVPYCGWAADSPLSRAAASLAMDGYHASERGDYNTAFSLYSAAAKLGDVDGMLGLEWLYRRIRKDPEKAYLWCTVLEKRSLNDGSKCIDDFSGELSNDQFTFFYFLSLQCIGSRYESCDQFDLSQMEDIKAFYASQCRVFDPTGTPLNIRKSPRGEILKTIENAAEVFIVQVQKDNQGKEWALINFKIEYEGIGWVFKEFLKCGLRKDPPLIFN